MNAHKISLISRAALLAGNNDVGIYVGTKCHPPAAGGAGGECANNKSSRGGDKKGEKTKKKRRRMPWIWDHINLLISIFILKNI